MALRPDQVPNMKEHNNALIVHYTEELERIIDDRLRHRHFEQITKKSYDSDYNWPAVKKYFRYTIYSLQHKHGPIGFLNISDLNPNERRRLFAAVRKAYNKQGWKTVLFYTEQGIIYNIAVIGPVVGNMP